MDVVTETTRRAPEYDEEGQGTTFVVIKPVPFFSLGDFAEAVQQGHGWTEAPGITVVGDETTASASEPLLLWIHVDPDEVDEKIVLKFLKGRMPKPDKPDPWQAKIDKGQDLEPEEMQQALRALFAGRN